MSNGDDVIGSAENALKSMMSLWAGASKGRWPGRKVMSYQRFRVLRAVANGEEFVPDIAERAGISLSTAADILGHLKSDRLLTREPVDFRTFKWTITPTGRNEFERTSKMLEELIPELKKIASKELKKWM